MEEDIVKISMLLDIYGNILTEKQNLALNKYYNLDLSLAEIAEAEGISRQAVADNIQKGKEKLYYFEEKLGLYEKYVYEETEISKIIGMLEKIVKSEKATKNADEITKVISKLGNLKKFR